MTGEKISTKQFYCMGKNMSIKRATVMKKKKNKELKY